MQQITHKIHNEFIPFNKNYTKKDLIAFMNTVVKNLELDGHMLEALTHKSFAHESKSELANNERLEFLGDSVLQLIITEILYKRYPELNEGKLSKLRSHLVNEDTLSKIALAIDLKDLILLGKGELKENGQEKPSILANAYEAIVGATYLGQGLEATIQKVVGHYKLLEKEHDRDFFALDSIQDFDPKSRLQEISQRLYGKLPEYKVEELKTGEFKIGCLLNGELILEETGPSKKQLMQQIAKEVLDILRRK